MPQTAGDHRMRARNRELPGLIISLERATAIFPGRRAEVVIMT